MTDSLIPHLAARRKGCVALNNRQTAARMRILAGLKSGVYAEKPLPCLCRSFPDNRSAEVALDTLIASCDRYGIPLRTVLCNQCGLLRSDPYLDDPTLAHFYTHDYRDLYAPDEFADPNVLFTQQHEIGNIVLSRALPFLAIPGAHVIEVGCGAGGILSRFQEIGAIVQGCDLDERYLSLGARQLGEKILFHGEIAELPDSSPGDMVILRHVLEHFRNPVEQLFKVKHRLSPRGLIYLEVPGIFSIRDTYGSIEPFLQNAHAWHWCVSSLDRLMSHVGFERLAGTEEVWAIYRQATNAKTRLPYDGEVLAAKVRASLRKTDRLRYVPSRAELVRRIVAVLNLMLGSRHAEALIRRIKSFFSKTTQRR